MQFGSGARKLVLEEGFSSIGPYVSPSHVTSVKVDMVQSVHVSITTPTEFPSHTKSLSTIKVLFNVRRFLAFCITCIEFYVVHGAIVM